MAGTAVAIMGLFLQGAASASTSRSDITPVGDTTALQRLAATGNFAGVSFNIANHTATIHIAVTKDLAKNEVSISELRDTQGWKVLHDVVSRSWADLQTVMDQVRVREPFAAASASTISQWSIDPDTNTVLIGFTTLSASLENMARQAFGSAVSFAKIPRGIRMANRLTDYAPFYGGDRLSMANGNGCTSGFKINIGSTARMLTAGHCDLWGPVYNGSTYMGEVVAGTHANGGWDTATISGSYAPYVWNGSVTTTSTHHVDGTFLPPVGMAGICTDGSYTGQNCNGQVVVANQGICHTWTDGTSTCHLGELQSTDG
ncbi:MAG: chymotrypsin family serine protease, partial [Microbacteriaceae bacterium]